MLDIDLSALKRRHGCLVPRSTRQVSLRLNGTSTTQELDVWCAAVLHAPRPCPHAALLHCWTDTLLCTRLLPLMPGCRPRRFLDDGQTLLQDCKLKGQQIPSLADHADGRRLATAELPGALKQIMDDLK